MESSDNARDVAGARFEPRIRAFAAEHRLSEREREILSLLLRGVPPKAMGGIIGCRYASVRTHLGRMCRKLGCSGSLELVLKFFGGTEV